MTAQSVARGATLAAERSREASKLYQEGVVAGALGAAAIAVWFLVLDYINGRPFYTPSVLGTALFRGNEALAGRDLPVSFEMIVSFTWIHLLVFALIGAAASRLLGLVEHHPDWGFGLILLFVVFEFGFVAVSMVFAQRVLQALTVPAILVGNLLAAAMMATYFWRHHPGLTIRP